MNQSERHYLFDYDGTLVVPEKGAWKSLEFAAFASAPQGWHGDLPLSTILEQTKGTTEQSLARVIARFYGIQESEVLAFADRFYQLRADYWTNQDLEYGEIFPDAIELLEGLAQEPGNNLYLLTGNPSSMIPRIHPDILKYFRNSDGSVRGFFGDQAPSRYGLIHRAYLQELTTRIITSPHCFYHNVIVIGDTLKEIAAALTHRMRVIYVPTHTTATDGSLLFGGPFTNHLTNEMYNASGEFSPGRYDRRYWNEQIHGAVSYPKEGEPRMVFNPVICPTTDLASEKVRDFIHSEAMPFSRFDNAA